MKSIREIVTDLNVARSNDCSQEKSEEIKGIINELLPYEDVVADFEWLKSKITLEFIDTLTDDDKERMLRILGIINEASNVND